MRPVLIPRCDGMGKPLKKPTPGQAAAGLEPGTSRVQSGALGAWPRFSVNSGQRCVPVLFGVLCPLFDERAPFVQRLVPTF
jgi:hypothetical protein